MLNLRIQYKETTRARLTVDASGEIRLKIPNHCKNSETILSKFSLDIATSLLETHNIDKTYRGGFKIEENQIQIIMRPESNISSLHYQLRY